MKVTILMCEGPHDVAFISRIMHADGYHTYSVVINSYPPFIADFLRSHITKGSLDDLKLQEARGGLFLPSIALYKDDRLLLLYRLNGDSKKGGRQNIVSAFDMLFRNSQVSRDNILREDDSLTIVYVYDADKKGVNSRINEINVELQEFLSVESPMSVTQAGFDTYNGIKYGAFIFNVPDEGDGHGRLEDLVLPLMSQANTDIRKDADILIQKRKSQQYNLFSVASKDKDKDFDCQKATIGIMGQLQKSGTPNSAIIEQSAYIDDTQIQADTACIQIIKFVNASFD